MPFILTSSPSALVFLDSCVAPVPPHGQYLLTRSVEPQYRLSPNFSTDAYNGIRSPAVYPRNILMVPIQAYRVLPFHLLGPFHVQTIHFPLLLTVGIAPTVQAQHLSSLLPPVVFPAKAASYHILAMEGRSFISPLAGSSTPFDARWR